MVTRPTSRTGPKPTDIVTFQHLRTFNQSNREAVNRVKTVFSRLCHDNVSSAVDQLERLKSMCL